MRMPQPDLVVVLGIVVGLGAGPAGAAAQLISLKTVPVAAGDQFMIHPSRNVGMGGVSIAIEDPLLDPFINPAWGSRLTETRLYGAPTFYSISGGDGSARTLPVGMQLASDRWFGGGSITLQQVESSDRTPGVIVFRDEPLFSSQRTLRDRAANNVYAFGMLGRHIEGTRLAVAASMTYANLQGVDGVDLLYALSERIEQDGYLADFRVGLTGTTEAGGAFEALLLHNRFDMTHDVTYLDWLPCTPPGPCPPSPRRRVETNLDRTNTWGIHTGYRWPESESGWRVGAIFTGNYKSHPKIPNYEIMNIPRDPGNTWAWNVGFGVARTDGPMQFAIDAVLEPIWSHTWAEAESVIRTDGGGTILPGQKTVENDFQFFNAALRMGVSHETDRFGLQLGLQVRSYSYGLEQFNHTTGIQRDQDESWMEWTPTWGGVLKFPELHIRYSGRVTTGTGRPGVAWTGGAREALDAALGSDIIIAPGGPLTLQDARVLTHQISVSLPIR